MSPHRKFLVRILNPATHRREDFDCGVPVLNEYLRKRANQEMKALAAACYVMVPETDPGEIAGYYTLSAASIELAQLPEPLRKKLPRYDRLGAILISRLARDLKFADCGIGGRLLMSALYQSYKKTESIGAVAIVVDAKDEAAAGFYSRFGFLPLEGSRLFLPMKDVPKWNPSVKS